MLTRSEKPLDIETRIAVAQQFREEVVTDSTAYRLVHAEADFLPALIIDRYGDAFTVQALDQGMDRDTGRHRRRPRSAVRSHRDRGPQRCGGPCARRIFRAKTKVLSGALDGPVKIHMNGFHMEADLLHGQKTGVFLDQRENYLAAARYAKGNALDCFTSTGGFALHLARMCAHVEAIDSSAAALATAGRNAAANDISNIDFREADVFEVLSAYASARRTFETIVLDPPAFAKSRKQLDGAMRGYKDINLRALRLLDPGGVLVTCSCSHHMSEAMLLGILAEASLDAGRTLRVLERRTQAAGPSDPPDRARDALPEVSDPAGGLAGARARCPLFPDLLFQLPEIGARMARSNISASVSSPRYKRTTSLTVTFSGPAAIFSISSPAPSSPSSMIEK